MKKLNNPFLRSGRGMKSLVPTPNGIKKKKKLDVCIHFKWEKAKIRNVDGKK